MTKPIETDQTRQVFPTRCESLNKPACIYSACLEGSQVGVTHCHVSLSRGKTWTSQQMLSRVFFLKDGIGCVDKVAHETTDYRQWSYSLQAFAV